MKIYNISEIPEGLRPMDYDAYLLSGYTQGYEDGYDAYKCYPKMYFTIEAFESGVIPNMGSGMWYSRNGGDWTEYLGGGFNVSSGDVIQFKKETTRIYNDFQGMQFRCSAYGNVMSLLYGDNFVGRTDLPNTDYSMTSLFSNSTGLFDASELVLPATVMKESSYAGMFRGCTSLVAVPELPATTLAQACYQGMFSGCTSLDAVPVLPATTLATSCYNVMFAGCTNLTTAPELPADTLANYCYSGMFHGCTSLVNAPELNATTLADSCYMQMFSGCTSMLDAPDLPATELRDTSYYQMFKDCTSLTGSPVISATTMGRASCMAMFRGCTSLTSAPSILPARTMVRGCYEQMFYECTSLTSAPELQATTLVEYCYQDMFHGCTSLVNAPELPATTLAEGCYYSMFSGCTSLTSAPELPATILAEGCYRGMFFDCSSLETAPDLLADTLVESCYQAMFGFCTSLSYIKCMATSINAEGSTDGWIYGINGEGVFEHPCGVDWSNKGYGSGIPGAWTVIDNCHHYENDYFTVEALADGQGTVPGGVKWRMNGGEWHASAETDTMVSMVRGDKIEMSRVADTAYAFFIGKTMPSYEVYGNAMSLIYGDDYLGQDTIPSGTGFVQGFSSCFSGQTSLVSAENLVLPATALTEYCYSTMFSECSSLTSVPELPATELAYRCYYFMFADCPSLTTAPELPATTLAEDCYQSMFIRCSNLVNATELPAETLVSGCYTNLFYGCSALDEITCLAVNNVGDTGVTDWWVSGVSATGTFYCPCRDIWSRGVFGIPDGWDVVDECPHYQNSGLTIEFLESKTGNCIPYGWEASQNGGPWVRSHTLTAFTAGDKVAIRPYWDEGEQAYHFGTSFFQNMGALTYRFNVYGNIMSLLDPVNFASATTIPEFEDGGFGRFFAGSRVVDASNLILPATALTYACYELMFQGCVYLTAAPALPATTMAYGCYKEMFRGCTSLATAPALPATSFDTGCYNGMFKNCTSLTAAPELLSNCCGGDEMFDGCTNLNYVKCLDTECCYYTNWLRNVSATGTFVKARNSYWDVDSPNGIPEGWTVQNV